MNILRQTTLNALSLSALLAATVASAQPVGQNGEPRRGPPPEAVAACNGKAAAAPCSFTGRQGETLKGVCFVPPTDRPGLSSDSKPANAAAQGNAPKLACRPDHPPGR